MTNRTKSETVKVKLSDNGSTYELKKHSSIIQMSSVATMLQRKLFNSLLRIANEELKKNSNARIFKTTIGQLKDLIGYDDNNKYLKQLLKQMQGTNVEYNVLGKDKQDLWGSFNILSWVQTENINNPNLGIIQFEFPSIVLSSILNPRLYAKLDLFLIKNLESKHTIALYEILKDYQNLGRLHINIEDFRKIMAIKKDQYSSVSMLKIKVIDVAVSEVNEKTDLVIDYSIKKEGRAIIGIEFFIGFKSKKNQNHIGINNKDENVTNELLLKDIMQFGINKKTAEGIISKYDEIYIQENIKIIKKSIENGTISNITAFAIKAFSNDYRIKETEYDKIKRKELQEKEFILKKKKDDEDNQRLQRELYEKEKSEFILMRDEKIDSFISMKPETYISSLKEKFISKNINHPFIKHAKNGDMSHKLIKPMWYAFLSSELLPEHESDFELHKKYGGGLFTS